MGGYFGTILWTSGTIKLSVATTFRTLKRIYLIGSSLGIPGILNTCDSNLVVCTRVFSVAVLASQRMHILEGKVIY